MLILWKARTQVFIIYLYIRPGIKILKLRFHRCRFFERRKIYFYDNYEWIIRGS